MATLPPATHELFERIKGRVAQVRIIERRSGTRSSFGSAFFVNSEGHAITNYHVVSSIVHHPEDYTAELVREGKDSEAVPVRLLDVVHDLAVIQVHDLAVIQQDGPVKDWFELEAKEPPQGTRLYAMGNPHDLGTTSVAMPRRPAGRQQLGRNGQRHRCADLSTAASHQRGSEP